MPMRIPYLFSCMTLVLALIGIIPTSALAKQNVVLQLKWFHQFQFAGYYAALEKGFYREEGLEVEIRQGGPQIQVDQEVLSGRAEFGILASELIKKRIDGKPLVLLSVIIQHSTRALMFKADQNITKPADLIGKKIMLNRSELAEFLAMFRQEGIDPKKLFILSKDWRANEKLISGEIDVINGSMANQPFIFNSKNIAVDMLKPFDYGVDFYGDSLFTTQAFLKDNPKQVAAFRRASLKGWQYAFNHVDEMIELIQKRYASKKSTQQLTYEAQTLRQLILPDMVTLGHINPERIQRIAETYQTLGIVDRSLDLDAFIYAPPTHHDTYDIQHILWAGVLVLLATTLLLALWRHLSLRSMHVALHQTHQQLKQALETAQESESRYRALFEGSQAVELLINPKNGQIEDANPSAQHFYGYSHAALCQLRIYDLSLSHPTRIEQEMSQASRSTQSPLHCQHRLASGQTRHIEMYSGPITIQNQRHLYAIIHDVTERIKTQQQLEDARKQAEQANRAKSAFLAVMSHEIRTPLNAILGMTDVLLDSSMHEKQKTQLAVINQSGMDLLALIEDILDLTQIESGTMLMYYNPIDLQTLAHTCIQRHLSRAMDKGLTLFHRIDPAVPEQVMGDPKRWQQILDHLLDNALKFTEQGEVILQISLTAPCHIHFSVWDTGLGIPPEQQQTIFAPFTQVDGSQTRAFGGMGLGLCLCKKLVDRAGGKIWVESKLSQGSVFNFTLPLLTYEAENETTAGNEPPQPAPSSPCACSILLAEDIDSNALVITAFLSQTPHHVEQVTDGQQALDQIQSGKNYDLILMDIQMPQMDGLEATRQIRNWERSMGTPHIPIVALTAHTLEQDEQLALKAGCNAYLTKPISKRSLLDTILRYGG
ncbi:ABC transporter substrate-binding protein [Magnetococcus sp. PR-3]|uniref:ABC transporter substrate-binding protein n=1 Tax=Magnetococcus sp. PR-3 TaxID=3120355 RepID=UPI002FCE4702